ncbi:MAG: GntR family transcriptional regulator [Oscillibacter sp.]|nr:GntR family transcriptional regulator [Oscillibacter sp.]
MEIIIRNATSQPIYDQIASQLKAQIVAGRLKPGEALPSIRALAKDLKISVITTKRAYDELEAAGFLNTVAGKGCFVAERDFDRIREGRARDMEEQLSGAIRLAKDCGMTWEDFRETARILWEEG